MRDPHCSRCNLGDYVRKSEGHVCIWADPVESSFQPPIDILIVGRNPGRTENREGRPFVGDSSFIRTAFEGYNVYVSNAVKCHSEDNEEPSTDQIEACRPHLIAELRELKPRLIFALGNTACKALIGVSGVNKLRLSPQKLRSALRSHLQSDIPVLCSIHPEAVLRYPAEGRKLEQDVEGAKRFLAGSVDASAPYVDATVADLQSGATYTFDIESSTANYRDPNYQTYCIGVWDGQGPVKILTDESNFHKVVSKSSIGFNSLGFDLQAFHWRVWQSIEPTGNHLDVMLLAYLNDETMMPINLEACAQRWLGVPPWKDDGRQFWDKESGYARKPATPEEWEQLKQYNARDVVYTHKLASILWNKLSEQQKNLYKYLLSPAAFSLARIVDNGFYVSRENLAKAKIETQAEIDRTLKIIQSIAEEYWMLDFNPNSDRQLRTLLFHHLGLKPVRYTKKTKMPSADEESLKILAQNESVRETCQAILDFNSAEKMRSSYVDKYTGMLEGVHDSRLHLPYHLVRTTTGRTSSPAQQMPRKKSIRSIVAAPPGYKLVVCDQSQIELRLMAWRAQEPTMLQVYHDDLDIHSMTAVRLVNLQRSERGEPAYEIESSKLEAFIKEHYMPERYLAKPVNFLCLYGGEAPLLQASLFKDYGLKVTFKQAQFLRDEVFFGTYPHLTKYYDAQIDRAIRDKCIISPFGRVRSLDNIGASDIETRAEAARQALNTDNQADASDITLTGLNLILDAAPWMRPVMFVHDCNIFEVPDDRVEEACEIAAYQMTTGTLRYIEKHFGVHIDVPLKVDTEVLQCWK